MARTPLHRLHDMRDAIDGIRSLVENTDFAAFSGNWGIQRAVERGLEIISEASRSIPDDLKITEPDIPWRQIAAIGNLLRHEYQRTDARATWNIVQDHLPTLGAATTRLIDKVERLETL